MKRLLLAFALTLCTVTCTAKPTPPLAVSRMELLERENAWLKAEALRAPYQAALDAAKKIDATLTAKYSLGEKDTIDQTTGTINRAKELASGK